jgi:septum site-determining protein MinD
METLAALLIEKGFNFVFIDCPAGIDIGFLNAIAPAREAIIVTTPEITSIRDADRVAGLLEANGVFNVKLLVNRVRADMIKKNDMMSVRDVQEMLGVPLLGAIPEDTNVIISTNRRGFSSDQRGCRVCASLFNQSVLTCFCGLARQR